MDDEEFEAWKAREPERFVEEDPFVPGGGIIKQLEEGNDESDEEDDE